MSWIFLSIAAHFCWAFVNIGDKYVVSNRIKNSYIYMTWLMMISAITLVIIPFVDFQIPDAKTIFWLFIASAFYFFGGFPYIMAMQKEEVTRINLMWNLIPVFSLIIGWIAINETLGTNQLIALAILITGSILASIHVAKKKTKISKALFLMLAACFSYASYAIILRHSASSISPINIFIWTRIFFFLIPLPLIFFVRKFRTDFIHEASQVDKKLGILIFILSMIDTLGILLNIAALSLGPAALVFSMEGFQIIFVFALAILISLFTKIDLKESLEKKNLLLKSLALIFMLAGIWIVNLS